MVSFGERVCRGTVHIVISQLFAGRSDKVLHDPTDFMILNAQ